MKIWIVVLVCLFFFGCATKQHSGRFDFGPSNAEKAVGVGLLVGYFLLYLMDGGSGSQYKRNYHQFNETKFKPSVDVSIRGGEYDMILEDVKRLSSSGYVCLGACGFVSKARYHDMAAIRKQARREGATLVCVYNEFAYRETGTYTKTTKVPPKITCSRTAGSGKSYNSDMSGERRYQLDLDTTITIPAEKITERIPYAVNKYRFFATFWTKDE